MYVYEEYVKGDVSEVKYMNIALVVVFGIGMCLWYFFSFRRVIRQAKKLKNDAYEGKPILTYANIFLFMGLYVSLTFSSVRLDILIVERIAAYATIVLFIVLIIVDFVIAKRNNFKYFK